MTSIGEYEFARKANVVLIIFKPDFIRSMAMKRSVGSYAKYAKTFFILYT
jgi:hypothetical protein